MPCLVPAHGLDSRPRHGPLACRARHGHGASVPGPCSGRVFSGRARSSPAGLARLENYSWKGNSSIHVLLSVVDEGQWLLIKEKGRENGGQHDGPRIPTSKNGSHAVVF